MKHIGASRLRIGGAALLAVFATFGIGGARASQDGAQPMRHPTPQTRQFDAEAGAHDSAAQSAPMRYYGGPKSPMWRG